MIAMTEQRNTTTVSCPVCPNTFQQRHDGRPKTCGRSCGSVLGGRTSRRTLYADTKTKNRAYQLRALYGLSLDGFDELLTAQNGLCAICDVTLVVGGNTKTSAHVDHDHTTNEVRGILCANCNVGLGKFHDDAMKLMKAAEYLFKL